MSSSNVVGELAGRVWHFLDVHGRSSVTAVEAGVDAPPAMVLMAVGWLAREGKVEVAHDTLATLVWLRGD